MLYPIGRLTEAREVYTRMEQRRGTECELYGHVLSNLATVCRDQGDLRKALELCQQSLSIKERTVGKGNESYAVTLHCFARVRKDQGDLRKALELYQQSLAIKEQTVGKDNQSYAATLGCIARVHQEQGDLANALELYQQSLKLLKFDNINRRICLDHLLSLLRETKVSQIVSGRLVGFVEAKLQFRLDVSDRELYLGFSHGTTSLVQWLLVLQLGHDVVQQCIKRAKRNTDNDVRTATLSLLSNGMPPCTEGLLLALSCGREDVAWEMMVGGVVATKECVAIAQCHASPEMAVVLDE